MWQPHLERECMDWHWVDLTHEDRKKHEILRDISDDTLHHNGREEKHSQEDTEELDQNSGQIRHISVTLNTRDQYSEESSQEWWYQISSLEHSTEQNTSYLYLIC